MKNRPTCKTFSLHLKSEKFMIKTSTANGIIKTGDIPCSTILEMEGEIKDDAIGSHNFSMIRQR
jgi:hypothetical protein